MTDQDFMNRAVYYQEWRYWRSSYCDECHMWFHRVVPFKAKGIYES